MTVDRLSLQLDRVRGLLRRTGKDLRQRHLYGRPFSRNTAKRVLLLSIDARIPQSQIHPFHAYADQIRARADAEIREITADRFLHADQPGLDGATTVCFQTEFDIPLADLEALIARIRQRNPDARLVYLDWFAPTDLRLAQRMHPHVALYVKKHVLADLSQYGRPTQGDTNLTDHFSRRLGLEMPETVFPIPTGFLDKLVIGPSFVTDDLMLRMARAPAPRGEGDRPIDLHARLGIDGTDWYQRMRSECLYAVTALTGVRALTEFGVGQVQYLHELSASKICFSPFGYGEVCWRDFEAVCHGAVLLKPDMSHIRTAPDIFVPGETYMPLRWDLADFEDKVTLLLGDAALRQRLTANAFAVLHDYVTGPGFVDQMSPIFD